MCTYSLSLRQLLSIATSIAFSLGVGCADTSAVNTRGGENDPMTQEGPWSPDSSTDPIEDPVRSPSNSPRFCGDITEQECEEEEIVEPPVEMPVVEPVEHPEEETVDPPVECGTASVSGVVCAPSGEPVVGAEVVIQIQTCMGGLSTHQAITDSEGNYALIGVAAGSGTMTIRAGSFEDQFSLTLGSGEQRDLSQGQTCFRANTTRLAVITGGFDSIENSIAQLGFDYDSYCGGSSSAGARLLLSDPALLSQYDVIFINCGTMIDFDSFEGQQRLRNLQTFVNNGGSVYASDLSAGIIDRAFPGIFNFSYEYYQSQSVSECCSCGANCPPYCGLQTQSTMIDHSGSVCMGTMPSWDEECLDHSSDVMGYGVNGMMRAQILNQNMRSALGRDQMDIHLDSSGWVQINYSPYVQNLIQGAYPLMVRYTAPSGGRVIYTSFHNEQQPSQDLQQILSTLIFEL